MFLFFILLAFVSLLPNLHRYPFKNEESLRTQIAFEMWHSGNYLQPTFLGELYFNKPPFFNWLIVLYSQIIPWSEMTARAVSLSFLLLTTLLVGIFSHYLFRNLSSATLSSLVFLTFGNVLFFYGFLAEIDMTFTFFVFLGISLLYIWWNKGSKVVGFFAGVVFGLAFLLKGLPAYAFMGISTLTFALYKKSPAKAFKPDALLVYIPSLLISLLWIIQTPEQIQYLANLWRESFSRVEGDFSRLRHMLFFPLLNFKDTLPWSFLFLLSLYASRKDLDFPPQLRGVFLLFLANYIPYWVSDSAGRYIMPLYPLLAILFAYYLHKALKVEVFRKLFLITILIVILLKFIHGLFFFPYAENRETSRKRIAERMVNMIDPKSSIACQCPQEKSVCLYLGLWKGEPLRLLSKEKEVRYVVNCEEPKGNSIVEFKLKDKTIRLEELRKDNF
ncbi:MAG: glycosyltransferase family 39 protein [Aquificaceae bacterium]